MKKFTLTLFSALVTCFIFGQSPFGAKQNISNNTGNFPRVIDAGHLNNDAYEDIVIGTDVGGTIEWYKNNGNGTFTLQTLISSSLPRVQGIAIADLDNDNDNDVIATSFSADKLVWFENNGSGSFGNEQLIAFGLTDATTVKAGDIDGNNTIDLVVCSYGTHKVSWFSNDGTGNFGGAQAISDISNSGPWDFDLADYDLDNDLDLVVAYGSIDAIVLFDNDLTQSGSPSFSNYYLVASANYGLRDVHFGDVDNNGDLEIIKADEYANTAWYKKSGSSFTETAFTTNNSVPSAVIISDVNNDNSNDVIVGYSSTSTTDELTWYKNSSSTGEQSIDNTQNDIYDFVLRDFDNDGDLDLATIATSQNHLNWFENIGNQSPCTDSDNDGVCDGNDICPGYDDTIDSDGDGTPDGCDDTPNGEPTCSQQTTNFPVANNTLTYSGSGTGETAIILPTDSQDISFTISGMESKTKGKGSTQFIDMVDVTYNNNTTTYSGVNVSSKTFNITGPMDGISIRLYNGLSGSNQTLSITLSDVRYCSSDNTLPCVDANNNGICDVDEPTSDCAPRTKNFNNNGTLSGTNSTTLNFEPNSQDVSFTITNINDKQKGKPDGHYIEQVVVTYNGSTVYGTFSGDQINSVFVEIPGSISSVSVALRDGLGNTSNISVNLSEVAYCVSGTSPKSIASKGIASSIETVILEDTLKIYPNPVSDVLFIKLNSTNTLARIRLFNITGTMIFNRVIQDTPKQDHILDVSDISNGLYVLQLIDNNGTLFKTQRIVVK
ncbi:T9SS type A sorting domain-containing protein [Aestuariivivens sediminis]|uniref:T9SS type A sorting domain-containing protein n=1 Tax=Aestuariivivens sediminis TaxID=2913557 RepID=UPI001F57B88E|nr:T9SS type A sorting domain-containing protein [Aestuariivivens sediminis]